MWEKLTVCGCGKSELKMWEVWDVEIVDSGNVGIVNCGNIGLWDCWNVGMWECG